MRCQDGVCAHEAVGYCSTCSDPEVYNPRRVHGLCMVHGPRHGIGWNGPDPAWTSDKIGGSGAVENSRPTTKPATH